ncbi:uncharacterized protein LOC117112939 [Anneissia japonica]|uniref:uncharacterized protein LOC117112939 n=1 Tax=Anneissia japonica TaxID=1529436 RepID=UPI00142577D8|nr:uncharacterized protein LOC117112939 [Anneissia japonica]
MATRGATMKELQLNADITKPATQGDIRKILERIDKLGSEINPRLDKIENKLAELEEQVDDHRQANIEEIESLKASMEKLENQSRRNNLIFKGIPQKDNEKWEETEKMVLKCIRNDLKIQDEIQIERVHRLNTKAKGSRIIARFAKYKDKQRILKNALKLKGSRISISEDFAPKTRIIRSKLLAKRREIINENENCSAKLRYDRLVVTYSYGVVETFIFNEKKNKVVKQQDKAKEGSRYNGSSEVAEE